MDVYTTITYCDALYLDASAFPKIGVEENHYSRVVRILIYLSKLRVFTSIVGFGEFISVISKKKIQTRIGALGYLYNCRSLLTDFDMRKIQQAEPTREKIEFIKQAEDFAGKYSNLGGGDIWHLMAATELEKKLGSVLFGSFDKKLVKAAIGERLNAVDLNKVDPDTLLKALEQASRLVNQ
jgi:hypothetical protein